jgi:Domain of unknown function (DUF4314)
MAIMPLKTNNMYANIKRYAMSTYDKQLQLAVGQRIELIRMNDDPCPVEPGTKGTVTHIGGDVINVDWDNGRRLGVIEGVDEYKTI